MTSSSRVLVLAFYVCSREGALMCVFVIGLLFRRDGYAIAGYDFVGAVGVLVSHCMSAHVE